MKEFGTESYFEKYEFSCPYFLSASDCETISIKDLLKIGHCDPGLLLETKLGYPETTGSMNIRSCIAKLYEGILPDEIVVLGAPVEGIFLAMNSLIDKSDHIIALSPAYDALVNTPVSLTSKISRWNLFRDGDGWRLSIDKLKELIVPETKMIVVNFPHNPTGFLPTRDELNSIIEVAKEHDLWIFSDEMYKGLEYRIEDELPSVSDIYEKSISLRGLSKTVGLAGLRFGWLVVKSDEVRCRIINWKYYTTLCSTAVSEVLGEIALKSFDLLASQSLETIKKNLIIADDFFSNHKDKFSWVRPTAGSVSAVELIGGDAEDFCHTMAKNQGVVLLPLTYMGMDQSYFRLGLGRKDFEKNIQVFASALNGN